MTELYLERFIRVLAEGGRAVFVGPDEDGHHLLVKYYEDNFEPPLVLDFREEEFDAAVHAAGHSGRSLWPGVPEPEAGFRLLLVHLDESMTGMKPPQRRVYISSDGMQLLAE
jgi:hypothetical protein